MSIAEGTTAASRASAWQLTGIMVFPAIGAAGLTMPLVVMPSFMHERLGYDGFVIGLVLGAFAVSTLIARPFSGRLADRKGARTSIVFGLSVYAVSGLLLAAAPLLESSPPWSAAVLMLARLVFGVSLALINVSALSWLFAVSSPERAPRVIGYNGIVAYGAMIVSPPLAQWLSARFGPQSVGWVVMLFSAAGACVVSRLHAPSIAPGASLSFLSAFRRVALLGIALGLGSVAMVLISTFSGLAFAQKQWANSAWTISAFGVAYIGLRLLGRDAVNRFGALRVTLFSFIAQTIGFLMLWLAPSPAVAILGSAVTGLGTSMLYPALAFEVVKRVPASSRSSALGAFSMFLDVAIGIASPLCGAVASFTNDFTSVYWFAGAMAFAGIFISRRLYREPVEDTVRA